MIYRYCEVSEISPDKWVGLTDTAVEAGDKGLLETLNYLGQQGWRLVAVATFQTSTKRFYFEKIIKDFE